MKKEQTMYIVVPCYNEESVLSITFKELKKELLQLIKQKKIGDNSKILFVDDGSTDKTWEMIENMCKKDKLFTGISLTRNSGHQNALLAGLMVAKEHADIIVSMDADLQDPPSLLSEMLNKYYNGNDIVYAVRKIRKNDTWFKKNTAQLFYKFMKLMGVEIIDNHADYRLTSKRVLIELEKYKEVNLFLRGIFPLIGFKSDIVYYERSKRLAGNSKYPLKKMLNFALDGITSFSIKPIRLVLSVGFIMFFISMIILIYCLIVKFTGHTVTGWTFIVCSIWIVAGIQMLAIGLIGEYIGKIYSETKRRPRYIIKKDLKNKKN